MGRSQEVTASVAIASIDQVARDYVVTVLNQHFRDRAATAGRLPNRPDERLMAQQKIDRAPRCFIKVQDGLSRNRARTPARHNIHRSIPEGARSPGAPGTSSQISSVIATMGQTG
jgi:hypothetical protein